MRFAAPWALWLLALVPVLALWMAAQLARRRRALVQFTGASLADRMVSGPSLERLVIASVLQIVAAVFLILAAARPQWGATLEQVSRQGVDVVLAVDISESMLADDLQPSRLARAQEAAGSLLDRLRGDRAGLVAFAGSAGVLCPLTLDDTAVRMFLDALTPDMISYPGTSLAAAIRTSMTAFDAEQKKYKVMVLLSDGEDQFEREDVEAAAKEAAAQGLVIHTVGVGTPQGGPIALRDRDGRLEGYKQDNDGRAVTTRLQEEMLSRIAQITGGHYFPATAALGELDRIAEAIAGMDTKELQARLSTQYEERYQIPLGAGLLALIAEGLISRRRRMPDAPRARLAARAALLAGLMVLPGLASPARAAGAASLVEEGNRLYKEGHLTEALEKYRAALARDPASPAVHYNIGNVLYKQGQYDKAYEEYRQAFPAPEKDLAQGARYNAGNSYFARQQWKDAIENFREALRMNPTDRDAKRNLELALQRLQEEQQKQQQQKQPPQQDDQEQKQQQQPQPQQGQPRDERQQPPQPQPDQPQQEELSKQEAMRILDALRQQDRPPKDQLKVPPPDRKPEKDW